MLISPRSGTPETNRTFYVNYTSVKEGKKKTTSPQRPEDHVKNPLRAAPPSRSASVLSAWLTPPLQFILGVTPLSHRLTPALSLYLGSPQGLEQPPLDQPLPPPSRLLQGRLLDRACPTSQLNTTAHPRPPDPHLLYPLP